MNRILLTTKTFTPLEALSLMGQEHKEAALMNGLKTVYYLLVTLP